MIFQTLEKQAKEIGSPQGISYTMIKKGKEYGFNFNQHSEDDVTLL